MRPWSLRFGLHRPVKLLSFFQHLLDQLVVSEIFCQRVSPRRRWLRPWSMWRRRWRWCGPTRWCRQWSGHCPPSRRARMVRIAARGGGYFSSLTWNSMFRGISSGPLFCLPDPLASLGRLHELLIHSGAASCRVRPLGSLQDRRSTSDASFCLTEFHDVVPEDLPVPDVDGILFCGPLVGEVLWSATRVLSLIHI